MTTTAAPPGPAAAGHRGREPKQRRTSCALGPVAEAFLTGAAAAGVSKLAGEIAEILTLQAAHGEPRAAGRAAAGGGVQAVAGRRRPLHPGRRRRSARPHGRPGRRWC